jgi:hypothetical protein
MSIFNLSNLGRRRVRPDWGTATTHVQPERVLRRVLAFTGKTIDDVVNDPITKRQVLGYYKLHRWIDRECEIGSLERQWNGV